MSKLKIGLIQMKVENDKKENLMKASQLVTKIAVERPDIVVLPEMFSCPYVSSNFPLYAEEEGDYTFNFLSNLAKTNNIYLVGGSIPKKKNKIYNTSYVFDRQGEMIGKHRKVHLFDIDIKNKRKI